MGNDRLRGDRHDPFGAELIAAAASDGRGQTVLSTSEAAAALGLSERRLRRAIARGELSADRDGAGFRVPADELIRYARQNNLPIPLLPQARVVALPSPADAFTALPDPGSRLIGRDAELESLITLLDDPAVRLVTLTGPGGIGKTRLALAAANLIQDHFTHGAIFIDLSTVTEAEHTIPAIAQALGLRERPGQDQRNQIAGFLRARDLLLVLDNVEQIIDAAPQIAQLSTQAAGVTLLVTSRAPLHVRGERELPVPLLPLPIGHATPDELLASDAGRLFVARAQEHDPAFAVDAQSAPVIAEICARLDGLPLAIELAAARCKTLPPRQLRDRLERRLPLLTGGPRDAPARHLTMRDAIAWSYDLLSPEERTLFRRLTVFVGGFTLEAAEAVSQAVEQSRSRDRLSPSPPSPVSPSSDTLDQVESLLDQSLLVREFGVEGEPRFRMLETIREYGLERLQPEEEREARAAHAQFFLRLAQTLRPLTNTQALSALFAQLMADEANLRAALDWLAEHGPAVDFAAIVAANYRYWYISGRLRNTAAWVEQALAQRDEIAAIDWARLLIGRAELLMAQGEGAQARAVLAETLLLLRAAGDPYDLAAGLIAQGGSSNFDGEYSEGEAYLVEALSVAETIGDLRQRAAMTGRALANLGVSARGRGDLALAAARVEAALRRFSDQSLDWAAAHTLVDLGDIAKDRGLHGVAFEHYLACLELVGARGERRMIADALAGIASAATAWGHHRSALLLVGAASALYERGGAALIDPIDVAATERSLDTLREVLGDDLFATTWADGRAMTLEAALATAAMVAPPSDVPQATQPTVTSPLTRREQDVLHLLAAGQTDREIAEALFIGPRTVSWHVASIIGKLGATTRREAVRKARTDGLV